MVSLARIALFPTGLAFAALAFVHAASEAAPGAPGTTSMTTTLNGQALTELVDLGFGMEMSRNATQAQSDLPPISSSLSALARRAFSVDPLEVSTIRTIALGELAREDNDRARNAMRLATQLSKRDSVTDLWLAQDYAQLGDVEGMTASFDHALRVSVRAREAMMKPLVGVLANEDSFAPLGKLLDKRPEWEGDFWQEFVRNPVALQNSARFFDRTGLPVGRLEPKLRERLYANLKASRYYDVLFDIARLDPAAEADPSARAAGKFASDGDPLGWTVHSAGAYSTAIKATSGELQIEARPGSFGIVADRLFRLDRDYTLAIRMSEAVPQDATVELVAVCGDRGQNRLARIVLAQGARSGEATIPAGACPYAELQLSFAVAQVREDAYLRVSEIWLRPA